MTEPEPDKYGGRTKRIWIRICASIGLIACLAVGVGTFASFAVAHGYQTGLGDVLLFGTTLFVIALAGIYLAISIYLGRMPKPTFSIRTLLLITCSYAFWVWLIN